MKEQSRSRGGGGPWHGRGPGGGMPVQKAKHFKPTFKRFVGYLKPHRWQLLTVLATALLATLFSILSPKLLGKATTKLFEGMMMKINGASDTGIDFQSIGQILLILAGLYVLSALFQYIQQYVMASVAQKMVYAMRNEVSEKLSRLPLKYYDANAHGEVLSRAINDVENIGNTLQQSLTQLMTSAVMLIGITVMMLTISPLITLIVFLTLPLSFVVTALVASRSQKHFVEQRKSLGELNGHIEEMFTGHEIIKAYGHERKSLAEFDQMNEKLYESGWKAQFISGTIMPMMRFINNIGYVLVCVVGGVLVTKRTIEVGDIQAFIQYSRQFSQPIMQLSNIANVIQSTIASAERVFEVLDEQELVPETSKDNSLTAPQGRVQFDQVTFGYKTEEPLIENMNIAVEPGQTVAIVGPTGAGKTTLINLLMRFYEISGGAITVDGVDIRDFKRGDLRGMFGMVLQDTWLFNGTIKDNIAYGRKDATEADIIRAAKAAHADHFIKTLPDGYDTMLNQEASNISQGQKQLLTIARAILADPAILILDEATSSVDSRTEVLIQKAMNEIMKGRTNFVIAHRLSTIRNADTILVMNHGRVIEKGNHDELLDKNGFYAELYQSQFSGNSRRSVS